MSRPQPAEKTCRACGELKPIGAFSLSRKATPTAREVYRSDCKVCCSTRAKRWFRDNPERTLANRRRYNLERTYGITPDQYAELLDAQGGVCAICGCPEPNAHGRTGTQFNLSVDHCHMTGRIRGLLCQKCNRAIGLLGDNVELLKKAIAYLQKE